MSVRILESRDGEAVLYCSTSDWAFGPVFEDAETAEAFVKWLPQDARRYEDAQLASLYCVFLASLKIETPDEVDNGR